MLNYIQRISKYKERNYFQINGSFLDLYTGALDEWSQNLDAVKDILSFASSLDLRDKYELLNVRFIGPEVSDESKSRFQVTALTADQLLADELGESEMWKNIKEEGAPKRHFLSIVYLSPKQNETLSKDDREILNDDQPNRKPKTIRRISDNPQAI